jgi:potassium-transporting ATPase KdpC subunit
MGRHISIAIRIAVVTIIVFGAIYPLVMTGIAQILFPKQANGSLVKENGKVIGSQLIGQQFSTPGYFHPRPSAAGIGYDAAASGGSNLAPTSKALANSIKERSKTIVKQNYGMDKDKIPVDMITSSGSGLDPDISLANANAQIPRVAKARGVSEAFIRELVKTNMTKRTLGFLGETRVNVLSINLAMDKSKGFAK